MEVRPASQTHASAIAVASAVCLGVESAVAFIRSALGVCQCGTVLVVADVFS